MQEPFEVPQLDASPGEPCYRAFLLDPEGGVASTEIIRARSDDEAIEIVRSMFNAYGIDLWDRGRLLGSYPPSKDKDPDASSIDGLPPRRDRPGARRS